MRSCLTCHFVRVIIVRNFQRPPDASAVVAAVHHTKGGRDATISPYRSFHPAIYLKLGFQALPTCIISMVRESFSHLAIQEWLCVVGSSWLSVSTGQ